ncbi:hypothetical protein [Oceanidesulfovibrio marinus]|uniref:Uncharacterized protein n=1 Tax=Oceanidesulfovibrio marinus TaxID=370038 RepID=A0ABX6NHR1_9BACT|nr:hypothetical protein [Oceanidesulfovibrio marinus]QJT10170.1 hypothetical protein E8L03_15065 [Oceanidesulfovibrio marinus]
MEGRIDIQRVALSLITGPKRFDPALLYVECLECGRPVLWRPARTRSLIEAAGLLPEELDYSCLIGTYGCPHCAPELKSFKTMLVRVESYAGCGESAAGRA